MASDTLVLTYLVITSHFIEMEEIKILHFLFLSGDRHPSGNSTGGDGMEKSGSCKTFPSYQTGRLGKWTTSFLPQARHQLAVLGS